MPAGTTYEAVATTTLTSTTATITFTSISNAYTDLIFVGKLAGSSGGNDLRLYFNSNSSGNYSSMLLYGNAGSATSFSYASIAAYDQLFVDYYGAPQGTLGENISVIHVQNYTSSRYKNVIFRTGTREATNLGTGTWRNTSAITAITFEIGIPQTFVVNSTITMYGIKAA